MGSRGAPLIGRQAELAALEEALADADGRSGAVALVAGEAGTGKSRLVEEFTDRCRPLNVAWGGCVDSADGLAYAPWTELLGWLIRDLGDAVVGDSRAELARLVANLQPHDAPLESSDKTRLFGAVVDVLARAAEGRLVCVIEDAHWIDAASRDLLIAVAHGLRRIPMLLVVTYRPDPSNERLRDLILTISRRAHRITLESLPDDAARDIAAHLTGEDPDGEAVRTIVARSAGNPLFIEELAHARDRAMPETVRGLLLARYNVLGDAARRLVRTAAVIGARAPRVLLASAAVLDDSRSRHAARSPLGCGGVAARSPAVDGRRRRARERAVCIRRRAHALRTRVAMVGRRCVTPGHRRNRSSGTALPSGRCGGRCSAPRTRG